MTDTEEGYWVKYFIKMLNVTRHINMYGVLQSSFDVLTMVLSALMGTSYISFRWLSRRLCWEWAWMIWLKVFLLSCLGGRAGGRPSSTSGDLREVEKEKCMFQLW